MVHHYQRQHTLRRRHRKQFLIINNISMATLRIFIANWGYIFFIKYLRTKKFCKKTLSWIDEENHSSWISIYNLNWKKMYTNNWKRMPIFFVMNTTGAEGLKWDSWRWSRNTLHQFYAVTTSNNFFFIKFSPIQISQNGCDFRKKIHFNKSLIQKTFSQQVKNCFLTIQHLKR